MVFGIIGENCSGKSTLAERIKEDVIMNTLKTIQTLSKIGRILSKIVYICCMVGFCGCIYHRRGYGIRLMECIEKYFPWAAEFHLDTPCWNERTNAFYKRLGYRIIKTEDGFVFYQKRKSEPNTIRNLS